MIANPVHELVAQEVARRTGVPVEQVRGEIIRIMRREWIKELPAFKPPVSAAYLLQLKPANGVDYFPSVIVT